MKSYYSSQVWGGGWGSGYKWLVYKQVQIFISGEHNEYGAVW